jgi:NitT/TauT family transport system permease protein
MLSRFVAFTSLGRKALPNQYDIFAFALILVAFIAITRVSHGLTLPLTAPDRRSFRSTICSALLCLAHDVAHVRRHRRLAGLHFVYATLAAKSRRAALSSFHCSTSCNRYRSSAFCRSR